MEDKEETMKNALDEMMPGEIVAALDKYIIGQAEAKKMIAIALRNRVRRSRLEEQMRDEISPKNILMIGPTGVGKTEIARRIARMANAPFIKVEATKYTEVGYVGRDVESMIRDLMANAVSMVREEMASAKKEEIDRVVEERLLDVLLPATRKSSSNQVESSAVENQATTREQFRQILRSGGFDGKVVDITVTPSAHVEIGYMQGGSSQEDLQEAMNSIGSLFQRPRTRRVSIKRAREIFTEEETGRVLDKDKVYDEAKTRTEQMGIIFLDEFDKIADTSNRNSSSVSREGVQRDILPIVEGTKVNTKWGVIDTTNILFIAAGAFSFAKPSDLIPELQGRFPIRVELSALGTEDFYRILTEPENALTKQYAALMATDGVTLDFTDEGLRRLAEVAYQVNSDTDNIGARRLHTVMEKLLEDVSYAPESHRDAPVVIDAAFVDERLNGIASSQDMSRYIL